jgi:hypothetical protein
MIMKSVKNGKGLRERLDQLTHEIVQLKSILIYQPSTDKARSSGAWRDLLKASEEVSNLWSGCSAVEEIQAQRGE